MNLRSADVPAFDAILLTRRATGDLLRVDTVGLHNDLDTTTLQTAKTLPSLAALFVFPRAAF